MKGKILALIFLFNFTSFLSLNAQWARTYGTSEDECAYSICQTSDGGYIVAGKTGEYLFVWEDGWGHAVPPMEDIWVLKLASDGIIEWQKIYREDSRDYAYSIQQTSDGGYIVGGRISISGRDIWVLKLYSDGTIEWQKCYGGRDSEEAYFFQQTNDGGYIVVGQTFSYWGMLEYDIWVLKLASDGTIEWSKTCGGSKDDQAYSIQQTIDGGYIVAGQTESFGAGSGDIWILKLASDGTIEWQKTYGGSGGEIAYSIQQTSDGGYIVAGAGSGDFLVLKLYSDGTIEWQKTYGGSESEIAHSIQQTSDGGYIVAGAGSGDFLVLKLASDGTIEWQKAYGGYNEDEASSIQQTNDGGYIVAGSTDSYGAGKRDFLILKLSSNGDIDPACRFVKESNAEVSDTGISPADTYITPEDTDITPLDTDITPLESEAVVYDLCSGEHTLSLSAGSGGTTVPQPGTYIYNHAARITISASPDEGYNFSEWSGDASGTANPLSIFMDSDKSINASFSAIVIGDVWEGANKSPCFIATAAYGSPLHPYVRILRDFRDKFLMSNKLGRRLVSFYYEYSPFVANLIAKHKVLKLIVQVNLLSLVIFSYSMVNFGPLITVAVFIVIFVPPVCLVWRCRRKFRRKNRKIKNTNRF
jgi:uncharacterized delta-60 repeat protein